MKAARQLHTPNMHKPKSESSTSMAQSSGHDHANKLIVRADNSKDNVGFV